MNLSYMLWIIITIEFSGYTWCQRKNNGYTRQIYTDLFSNYTKGTLPVPDYSRPLEVGIKFYLTSIHKFSEIEETISVSGSFILNWTDSFIAWDPALYGDTNLIIVDATDVWTPPIMLTNTAEKLAVIGGDSKFVAYLFHDGQVSSSVGDVFKANCKADISKFPFDEQQCDFIFMTWGLTAIHLNFSSLCERANLDYFFHNAEWKLKEVLTKVRASQYVVSYEVSLNIKRSSLYYIVMVISPTVLFGAMNPLVFMLPVESGERVGLSMTILLSYAIFLTIVSSSIPASSNPMCVLLIVMVVIIFISGIIVFGVILSVKYFNLEDIETKDSCFKFLSMCIKRRKEYKEKSEEKISGKDVSKLVDSLFFYGSYIVFITTFVGFAIYTHLF